MTQLKIIVHIAIGIFLGVLFYGYGNNGAMTFSNSGFLIVTVTYLAYTAMLPAVCKFPAEIKIIKKESFNNWYRLRTFYVAHTVASIPTQSLEDSSSEVVSLLFTFIMNGIFSLNTVTLMFAVSYSAISYCMSGQPMELERAMMFHLVVMLLNISAESFGVFFGTILNPINGTFVGAVFTAYSLLLGGYFVQYAHMNSFFYLLTYTSFYSYSWDAMMQTLYGFQRDKLPCPDSSDFCLYNSPHHFIKEFGLENYCYWNDILCLLGIIFSTKVLSFYTLKRMARNN